MDSNSTVRPDAGDDGAQPVERIADPFAVDLFAANRLPADLDALSTQATEASASAASSAAAAGRRGVEWQMRLPRVSSAQAQLSSTLETLFPAIPEGARQRIPRLLARYARLDASEVSTAVAEVRETEFAGTWSPEEMQPRVWAEISIAPEQARVAAELEASFAAALVDRLLGGDGATPLALRELSLTERTVIEFLWLNLFREVNEELDSAVWHLEAVSSKPPQWLARRARSDGEGNDASTQQTASDRETARRGLAATARVEVGSTKGLVRFYLTTDALGALDAARNPLLSGTGAIHGERMRRIAPLVSVHPVVGETEVVAAALAELEPGDIVVVTRPWVRPAAVGGYLSGEVRVRLGDASEASLVGTIEPPLESASSAVGERAPEAFAAGALRMSIRTIKSGGSPLAPERLKMSNEMANDTNTESAGVSLEELWLTLRVELAARSMTLEELSRLRVGQLLELGCKATDPVELLVGGRRIARGELVDIEGQLGLRITQLAG